MSSAARIEELQKKFDENPRRYFAPLANECRKAGDLDAAIAICRTHLPQQPGHMSGHIVFGQALFESGELGEAQAVFETALGLDPENLIALRHMGDIAARHGDMAGARQWYMRVLETDPRNEEIQSLVAGLGQDPATVATGDFEPVDFDAPVELDPAEDVPRVRGGLPTLVDPALLAAAADAIPEGESVAPAFDETLADAELADAGNAGFDGGPLVTSEFEAAAAAADTPRDELLEPTAMEFEAPPVDAGPMEGLEATTFEAPSAGEVSSYERVGDEALLDDIAGPAAQLEGLESTEFDASGYGGSGLETIAAASFEFEPADAGPLQDPPVPAPQDSSATPPQAEAFVTETMAELYLRQGYREDALGVYRKLVSQTPDDAALRSRMERLEAELAADPEAEQAGNVHAVPEAREADGDDVIAGLPRSMEPALVAAAAEAGEPDSAPVAATPSGPTIREFLFALATGTILPPQEPASESTAAWDSHDAGEPAATAAEWDIAAADESADDGAVATEGHGGEIAEVVDLGEFDLAGPEGEAAEPATPSGDGLDALFGAPAEADLRAADVLASAFVPDAAVGAEGEGALQSASIAEPAPEPVAGDAGEPAADPLRGRPARPAGNDLSLDHVFGAPRQPGASRNTGGFSFDQFFAEGAAKPAREEVPEQPAGTGDEEDLEQFNSWLHNLRKP